MKMDREKVKEIKREVRDLLERDCYHTFHICFCSECQGKVWSHSEGSWDVHLRYVDPDDILTLPTGKQY